VKTKVTDRIRKEKDGSETKSWEVRLGSALLKVYFTPSGSRELYTISYWIDGKRKRQVFPTLEAAIAEAKTVGGQLTKVDFGSVDLPAAERMAAARALQLLNPVGVSLELAASEHASAAKRLGRCRSRKRWIFM
jgi:hypothetical protein